MTFRGQKWHLEAINIDVKISRSVWLYVLFNDGFLEHPDSLRNPIYSVSRIYSVFGFKSSLRPILIHSFSISSTIFRAIGVLRPNRPVFWNSQVDQASHLIWTRYLDPEMRTQRCRPRNMTIMWIYLCENHLVKNQESWMNDQKFCCLRYFEGHLRNTIKMLSMRFKISSSNFYPDQSDPKPTHFET